MTPPSAGGLRVPFFVVALGAAVIIVGTELAAGLAFGGLPAADATHQTPPGLGIRALALVDGLLLFTLALIGSSIVIPQRLHARWQGVVTVVVCLTWIAASLALAMGALSKALLMVGLLFAFPFGTLVYLIKWSSFPVGASAGVLGALLALKVVLVVYLVLAQPRFLQSPGLMVLIGLSVGMQLGLGLVQGLLPGIVVSIGDQLWAFVTAIVGLIWAVVTLVLAIPSIVAAVAVSRSVE